MRILLSQINLFDKTNPLNPLNINRIYYKKKTSSGGKYLELFIIKENPQMLDVLSAVEKV